MAVARLARRVAVLRGVLGEVGSWGLRLVVQPGAGIAATLSNAFTTAVATATSLAGEVAVGGRLGCQRRAKTDPFFG